MAVCARLPNSSPSTAKTAPRPLRLDRDRRSLGDDNLTAVADIGGDNAGREDADVHDAHVLRPAGRDDAGKIVAGPDGGHVLSGARVEQVVIDLGGIEAARADDLFDGRRFAQRGQPDEARQARFPHPLEAVGDAVRAEHVVDADSGIGSRGGDRIVQLQ